MLSAHARSFSFFTLALAATTGFAARGVLQADGVLRVKGADLSTTSITVVPNGAPSYSLPIGTKHFTLLLPLDDVYLISVAAVGCPTKEIYLDTRVPVEMHATDFQFPFMVTLEHMAPELMFVYAGPVGFVRYLHPLKDFGYETQYVAQVDESLKLRMETVRATGVDPRISAPMLPARVVDRARGAYSTSSELQTEAGPGTIAPVVSDVAPMFHLVNAVALPVPLLPEDPTLEPSGTRVVVIGPTDVPLPSLLLTGLTSERDEELLPVLEPSPILVPAGGSPITRKATTLPSGSTNVELRPSLRTEELITAARSLTRIVRFSTPSDGVVEFRKVTHAFGAVYYFQGNRSITERAFEEATAPLVDGAL